MGRYQMLRNRTGLEWSCGRLVALIVRDLSDRLEGRLVGSTTSYRWGASLLPSERAYALRQRRRHLDEQLPWGILRLLP
jgi:hypothetical protein